MSNLLLEELRLANFRLYEEAVFSFAPGLNVILGPNGTGKTSLLEGIFTTLTGASFRTQRTSELVRHCGAALRAELLFFKHSVRHQIALWHDGKQRRYQYNRCTPASRNDILGLYPVVLFSQEDVALVKGAPQLRRRYLDLQLAQSDPLYCYHLGRYTRALRQRNTLLRRGHNQGIEAWEALLAGSGAYLVRQRLLLIEELQKRLDPIHRQLVGEEGAPFGLRYRPAQMGGAAKLESTEEISVLYLALYAKMRQRERELGATAVGPHRDELVLLLGGKELRMYASDGQQKACAAALRIAEWESVQERVGLPPLLLIDDLGTSLDPERRRCLLELASSLGQVVVTAVSKQEVQGVSIAHQIETQPVAVV
jgi:DNA replication and repair protein RecF